MSSTENSICFIPAISNAEYSDEENPEFYI